MPTLFVTVVANFLILLVLPFSHKISVYIPSKARPTSLFVMTGEELSLFSSIVVRGNDLWPEDMVDTDARPALYLGFGVLDVDERGW